MIVKAPGIIPENGIRIFLSGSIEMGKAEQWQERISTMLDASNVILLNPRRDDWDNTWEQSPTDKRFAEQVQWELRALDVADIIVCYFAPGTNAPITLLEFGLHAKSHKMFVCCPVSFYRYGNVQVTCNYYGVPTFQNFESLVASVKIAVQIIQIRKDAKEQTP